MQSTNFFVIDTHRIQFLLCSVFTHVIDGSSHQYALRERLNTKQTKQSAQKEIFSSAKRRRRKVRKQFFYSSLLLLYNFTWFLGASCRMWKVKLLHLTIVMCLYLRRREKWHLACGRVWCAISYAIGVLDWLTRRGHVSDLLLIWICEEKHSLLVDG